MIGFWLSDGSFVGYVLVDVVVHTMLVLAVIVFTSSH